MSTVVSYIRRLEESILLVHDSRVVFRSIERLRDGFSGKHRCRLGRLIGRGGGEEEDYRKYTFTYAYTRANISHEARQNRKTNGKGVGSGLYSRVSYLRRNNTVCIVMRTSE